MAKTIKEAASGHCTAVTDALWSAQRGAWFHLTHSPQYKPEQVPAKQKAVKLCQFNWRPHATCSDGQVNLLPMLDVSVCSLMHMVHMLPTHQHAMQLKATGVQEFF